MNKFMVFVAAALMAVSLSATAIHGRGDAQITEQEVQEVIKNEIHGKGDATITQEEIEKTLSDAIHGRGD